MSDQYLGFTENQWDQLKSLGKGRAYQSFNNRGRFSEQVKYFQHPENAQPPNVIIVKEQTVRGYDGLYDDEYTIIVESEGWRRTFESFSHFIQFLKEMKRDHTDWFVEGKISEPNRIGMD